MSGAQDYQQMLQRGDPGRFCGLMDLKMLGLFNVICTSAMYEVTIISSYVFCNTDYSFWFMLADLLLHICSHVRPLKDIKSNLLFQAGLTPKLGQ